MVFSTSFKTSTLSQYSSLYVRKFFKLHCHIGEWILYSSWTLFALFLNFPISWYFAWFLQYDLLLQCALGYFLSRVFALFFYKIFKCFKICTHLISPIRSSHSVLLLLLTSIHCVIFFLIGDYRFIFTFFIFTSFFFVYHQYGVIPIILYC